MPLYVCPFRDCCANPVPHFISTSPAHLRRPAIGGASTTVAMAVTHAWQRVAAPVALHAKSHPRETVQVAAVCGLVCALVLYDSARNREGGAVAKPSPPARPTRNTASLAPSAKKSAPLIRSRVVKGSLASGHVTLDLAVPSQISGLLVHNSPGTPVTCILSSDHTRTHTHALFLTLSLCPSVSPLFTCLRILVCPSRSQR